MEPMAGADTMTMNNLDQSAQQIIDGLCSDLLSALDAFETIQRQFDPGIINYLQEKLLPVASRIEQSRKDFQSISLPSDPATLYKRLGDAVGDTVDAIRTFSEPAGLEESLINFRKAKRKIGRTQEKLFSLRKWLPSVNRFFAEEGIRTRINELDPMSPSEARTGLIQVGMDDNPYARGSFSLYVPESYDASRAWPVVISLHGGFGHGRDFIWTWLREARSRRFILVAPTSQGTTWSITGLDVDSILLNRILAYLTDRWNIDKKNILLTGLSDGATYSLARALDEKTPFRAFAPVAAALPPFDFRHVRGRRIYWVHGAFDWMFTVDRARQEYKLLEMAGADVTLNIIKDLSHTYPREQNEHILTWFDPSLALQPSR
jgi:phospholipase/carboxylesterase